MGCGDSKTDILPQQKTQGQIKNKDKKVKFAQRVQNQAFTIGQEERNNFKQKKSRKNIQIDEVKSNKTDKIKSEMENVTKVKRAKELQNKPDVQKFISDIVYKSRSKLTAIVPPTQVSPKGFIKPVIAYSPQKKGDILSRDIEKDYNRSQWERLINQKPTQNLNNIHLKESYIGVNQTIKSPYKQKQIERRLNEFRFQSSDLGKSKSKQIHSYELFDSNKTLYL